MTWYQNDIKRFLREGDDIAKRYIAQVTEIFSDDTPHKQVERIARAQSDFYYFAQVYFPHYASKPFGDFHHYIHDNCINFEIDLFALYGPREHGKTVEVFIIEVWLALTGRIHFAINISETLGLAKERNGYILLEFEANQRIIHDYGEQVVVGYAEKGDFEIKKGVRFLALGYGMPVLGKLYKHYRPDFVWIDEFEKRRNIKNFNANREKKEWVKSEVYGGIDETGIGKVVWTGNIVHKKSALNMFISEVEERIAAGEKVPIAVGRFAIVDKKGKRLWPEGWSKERMAKKRSGMGTIAWLSEMMQEPPDDKDTFQEGWFVRKSFEGMHGLTREIKCYVDPSVKATGDFKAIITMSRLADDPLHHYLEDVWIRKATIQEMVRHMYVVHKQFKPYLQEIQVEAVGFAKLIKPIIELLARDYGYMLPIRMVDQSFNKEIRIQGLSSPYENGYIIHDPSVGDTGLLEEQLLGFGSPGMEDDGPDAEEGCYSSFQNGESFSVVSDFGEPEFGFKRKRASAYLGI
ncbi:hypothetical protein HQ531_03515 [bacterium]|nr:hypothetical protein [bacterium]